MNAAMHFLQRTKVVVTLVPNLSRSLPAQPETVTESQPAVDAISSSPDLVDPSQTPSAQTPTRGTDFPDDGEASLMAPLRTQARAHAVPALQIRDDGSDGAAAAARAGALGGGLHLALRVLVHDARVGAHGLGRVFQRQVGVEGGLGGEGLDGRADCC